MKTGLGPRFDHALVYASIVHGGQRRKGTKVPYVAHLLGTCALVLEDGGSEDEAIAALLHDAVEDQGGKDRLRDIRRRFGREVAEIVRGCTDTFESPKPPWLPRKQAYLLRLRKERSKAVLRVSLADKLHNARALLRDIQSGAIRWKAFNAGPGSQLWYYRSAVKVFRKGPLKGTPMVRELERTVAALERTVAALKR
jgi:(p)ppGpp synthase/HD superfamily hydrolase